MAPDQSPFPRITIVSGRVLLFVASLALMAYALFLTWGESPREPVPTMTPQTVAPAVPLNGNGRP